VIDQPADGDHHYEGTLHAIQTIIEHEGIAGLYSGLAGSLAGVASTNFAYFYWYSIVRTLYLRSGAKHTTASELSLGAVAGALAQLFTIPIAVVTARQQTQRKHERKGIIETGREVVNSEDGWTGLWRGLKASLILVVNPSITYGAYQRLREKFYPGRTTLRPHEAFCESSYTLHSILANILAVLGALSKMLATIVTQPLIVAKVGLQSRPPPERQGKPFKSFGEVMSYIIEHEGPLALFKGIGPQITKGFLVQGILMMTKEKMEMVFIMLFAYVRIVREKKLRQLAEKVKEKAKEANIDKVVPQVVEKVKEKAENMV
jgi:hypothetical protein